MSIIIIINMMIIMMIIINMMRRVAWHCGEDECDGGQDDHWHWSEGKYLCDDHDDDDDDYDVDDDGDDDGDDDSYHGGLNNDSPEPKLRFLDILSGSTSISAPVTRWSEVWVRNFDF